MRILILSTLLASVALPSAALAGPDDQQRQRHARATSDDGDPPQRQRSVRSSTSDSDDSARQRPARSQSSSDGPRERPAWAQRRSAVSDQAADGEQSSSSGQDGNSSGSRRAGRRSSVDNASSGNTSTTSRSGDGGFAERAREFRRRHGGDQASGTTTTAPTGQTTRHRDGGHRWSGDWRKDRRYDWNRYRDRHRSTFRLGIYFDPYGYQYRRYSIGWAMWPNYYRSSYWLDDPWMYRLPPAFGPYRWVRYWDDALLVDIYTGEVVDVIYSFFW